MKYQAPYGVSDPLAGYVNGNPQTGVQGSIPPAASIEFPQREIVNLISSSNLLPDDGDLFQLTKGTRSQWMNFANDTGSVNALVVALIPALQAYTVGLPLRIRVLHDNLVDATHTSMTLDAGAGPAPIRKMDGSSPANAEIRGGALIEVAWDGTAWQLVNFGGAGGGGTTNFVNINIPYVVDTGTVNNIIGPFSPAITVLNVGAVLLVKIANSVTDVTTLKVNALAPHPVKAPDGSDLLPGDVIAGDVVEFVFDGTNFYIRPNPAITVNCTINVPTTRFPTVASLLAAITRKTIAPTAFLTIQLAVGIYTPIRIYHKDADQIILKGTMLTGAPTWGNLSATGNVSQDAANNTALFKASYGTEIRNNSTTTASNAGQGYSAAIWNAGPGKPTIQDILVSGDGIAPGQNPWTQVGVFVLGTKIACRNVAAYGENQAWRAESNGYIEMADVCMASGNGGGLLAQNGSSARISKGFFAVANGEGMGVSGNASIYIVPPVAAGVQQTRCNFNSQYGVGCGLNSVIFFYGAIAVGNGIYDAYVNGNGEVYCANGLLGTYAPAPLGTMGNDGAIIYNATSYLPGPV